MPEPRFNSRRRYRLFLAIFAGLLLTAYAAWDVWSVYFGPRNFILITVDTLRPDRLSTYGYEKSSTPAMDRLAHEGVRFDLAYCDIPWTTGSLASTMTGTYGPKHGVRSFTTRLPDDRTTLAEWLRDRQFTTGAVVASFAVDSAFNLDQGFQSYDDTLDTPVFLTPGHVIEDVALSSDEQDVENTDVEKKLHNNAYRSDSAVTDAAIRWIDEHADERFFLWVHYFGPHERLVIEKGVDLARKVVDDYDPDTRAADAAVGRLLGHIDSVRGLARRSLVVLHSDHGQAMREHGIFGHGHDLHEESMRIPLLMRLPGEIPAGTVVGSIARNVDLFSTAMDYLGAVPPAGLDGRSLRPAIEGRALADVPAYMELLHADRLPVLMPPIGEYFATSDWFGMRSGPWKYMRVSLGAPCIRNPASYQRGLIPINPKIPIGGEKVPDEECSQPVRQDLYRTDAAGRLHESIFTNLVGKAPRTLKWLGAATQAVANQSRDQDPLELDEEQRDKLKSLGYLQ